MLCELSRMARKTMRSLTALQTALMGNIGDIKLGERSTVVDVDDALDGGGRRQARYLGETEELSRFHVRSLVQKIRRVRG